jgi:hypothetical protein
MSDLTGTHSLSVRDSLATLVECLNASAARDKRRLMDKLLEDFVRQLRLHAQAVELLPGDDLPRAIRRIIAMATNHRQSWTCWKDPSGKTWLFVAEMSRELSDELGVPVLHVDRFDEAGEVAETGNWLRDELGEKWHRYGD